MLFSARVGWGVVARGGCYGLVAMATKQSTSDGTRVGCAQSGKDAPVLK